MINRGLLSPVNHLELHEAKPYMLGEDNTIALINFSSSENTNKSRKSTWISHSETL